ncbi:MAG TPA: AEC family transporter [Candidatus Limiplasma sp.]|nr:AEC family transporter [Candidatus Limiplasma sp.]HRX08330.1 AEC family transporter [Candidatus Limiplasma sp.]
MWTDLLFSVNTIVPIILIISVGYIARIIGLIGAEGIKQGNRLVFYIFLPLLLFYNTKDAQIDLSADLTTIIYAVVTVTLGFVILFLLVPRMVKDRNFVGVVIQGIGRANYAIFGIPLVMLIYPGSDISVAAVIVICVIPIFNVLSTVALILYGEGKTSVWKIVKGILTNPLIIGTLLGLAFLLLNITLPPILDTPIQQLGSIATPFALFLLGTNIDFSKARTNLRLLTGTVIARLVLLPLVFLAGAIAIGIRDVNLAALIALYASPTAVSSFPMAQHLGGDVDFAAQQVIFTTAFSGITIFLFLFALKSMGFLA